MCAINFDPAQYGFTEKEWNSLTAKQKQQFQMQCSAWTEAQKEQFVKTMQARHGDAADALAGEAIKEENKDKGIAVESSALSKSAADAKARAAKNTIPLEQNDALQKQKLEKYKKDYEELYKKDPKLAKEDTVDVLYAKQKSMMEEAMKNMRESSDGRVALADRYLREFASDKDTAKFAETFEKYLEKYKDKEQARLNFNSEFDLKDDDEGYIRPGMTPTDEQIRMVAHRKALLESVNVGNDDIDKMASKFLQNRYLNGAMNTMAKYDAQISEAVAKGDTKKAEKLKQKALDEVRAAKHEEIENNEKDKKELIEMMAQAKLDREIAEERVANRRLFMSENDPGYDKNNPNHKVLTQKMQDMVKEFPETFCDENGKFDENKFKDFFVRVSNENETDEDGYEKADYMTSIQNRKRGHREKDILKLEKEIAEKYPEYANEATRKKFLENNPKIANELNYSRAKAKLKDRNFQGACAKICGLDKEKDKLAQKMLEHVGLGALKGAGAGFVSGCLAEGLATTNFINVKYAGVLQFAGTVGYKGYKDFKVQYEHNGTVDYTHNGTVDYTHNGTVDYTHNGTVDYTHNGTVDYTHNGQVGYTHNGSVGFEYSGSQGYTHNGSVGFEYSGSQGYTHNGSVGFEYSGSQGYTHNGSVGYDYSGSGVADYTASGSVNYSGSANYTHNGQAGYTHNGSVGWEASGTTPSEWTWEKWENGVLEDNGTITKDVPWSANGTQDYTATGVTDYTATGSVNYGGSTNYTHNGSVGYNYSGSGVADYTATGSVNYSGSGVADYTATGSVNYSGSGTVDYTAQGDVSFTGSGTTDYTANGKVDYTANGKVDYTANGKVDYTANGKVDYTANGKVDYTAQGKQDYTARGEVDYRGEYEGEQDYKGEKEYEGVKRMRHKFDWKVPLKAAAFGAGTGAIMSLFTLKNVKYDGGGPKIEARKKVAERAVGKRDALPPLEAQPVRINIPKPDLNNIKIEPIVVPPPQAQEYYDYTIKHEPGQTTEAFHEIKYKENPKTIIEGRYNVKVGTPEYRAIQAAMFKESGYETGTNLYVGDKFALPTVEVKQKDGSTKIYKPNDDPSSVKPEELGSEVAAKHLKKFEVRTSGGGYYVLDITDPQNPKRMTGLLTEDQAKVKLKEFQDAAEKAGKRQKPKE